MATFADLLLLLRADTSDIDKKLQATRKELNTFGSQATAMGASFSNLGTALTAAITVPLAGIGVAALKLSGDLEQNRIAFTTMLGSADQALVHLQALRDFAQKTPFEFTDLVQASKKLQALGFSAGEVIPTLTAVGNAAAALGTGAQGIDRITLALGQMLSKGTVQAQEMKQLAEAGIPAWQILAKTLNTDVAEAMKLVEKRAVDAGTAVPAILAGINERFGGLMQAQNATLLGQLSNLKDRTVQVLSEIGDTMAPTAKKVIDLSFQIVSKIEELSKSFSSLPQPVKDAAVGLAAFAAAAGPAIFIGGQMFSAVGNLAKGFSALMPYLISAGLPAGFTGIATAGGIAAGALVALAVLGPKLLELASNVKAVITALSDASPIKTFTDVLRSLGLAIEAQIPLFGKIKQAAADGFKWTDLLGPLPRALDAANAALNSVVDKTAGMGDAIAANLHKLNVSAEQTSKSWEDNLARKAAAAVQAMRDKAEEAAKAIKEAFAALDVKDVALETKKLADAFALLSKSGVASTDELSAASENLRVKLVELRETVNQAPLKALGVSETVAGINIALASFSVLNDRLLAGTITAAEYGQAFATVSEKLKKFKEINDQILTKPFADMLAEGNKKLLEQIATVQALGAADKAFADGQLDNLINKQVELAKSVDIGSLAIHSVDSILKAFGQKTVTETAAEIKILKQRLDDANSALRVGIPGAALAARIAFEELYRATHAQKLFDEQILGIPDLGLLKLKLGDAEQAYRNLAANGILNATTSLQGLITQQQLAIQVAVQQGQDTTNLRIDLDAMAEALGRQTHGFSDLAASLKQIELGGIQSAFHDLIFNAGNVADSFKKMGESIVDTVVNRILKDALSPLLDSLDKVIIKGVSALEKLAGIGIPSLGGATPPFIPSVGGIPGIPSVGSMPPTLPPPTGSIPAGTPLDTATGGLTNAMGSLSSALTGFVAPISAAVTAVTSVISVFQNMHQETSLNAIEANTRITSILLGSIDATGKAPQDADNIKTWTKTIGMTLQGNLPSIRGALDGINATTQNMRQDTFGILTNLNSLLNEAILDLQLIALGGGGSTSGPPNADQIALLSDATRGASNAVATAFLNLQASLDLVGNHIVAAIQSAQTFLDPAKIIGKLDLVQSQLLLGIDNLAKSIDKSLNPLGTFGEILKVLQGGLSSITGGIGSAISGLAGGGIVGGVIDALTGGGRQEGSLNAIELNTRITSILLGSMSADGKNAQDADNLKHWTKVTGMTSLEIKSALYDTIHNDLVGIWGNVAGMLDSFRGVNLTASMDSINASLVAIRSEAVTISRNTTPGQQTFKGDVYLDMQEMWSSFVKWQQQSGGVVPGY